MRGMLCAAGAALLLAACASVPEQTDALGSLGGPVERAQVRGIGNAATATLLIVPGANNAANLEYIESHAAQLRRVQPDFDAQAGMQRLGAVLAGKFQHADNGGAIDGAHDYYAVIDYGFFPAGGDAPYVEADISVYLLDAQGRLIRRVRTQDITPVDDAGSDKAARTALAVQRVALDDLEQRLAGVTHPGPQPVVIDGYERCVNDMRNIMDEELRKTATGFCKHS